jgi:hypothetical protein
MSDWQEQAKNMYATWSDTQKSLLENWTESVQSISGTPDTAWWDKTLEVWEKTVENAFSSQAEMTESWIGNMSGIEGMPAQAIESLERFQEMAGQWQGTQNDLWNRWFEMVKGLSPVQSTEQMTDAFQTQLKTWQEATQKVMEAQEEWMKIWTGAGKETAEKK